jgi:hypothetical protein
MLIMVVGMHRSNHAKDDTIVTTGVFLFLLGALNIYANRNGDDAWLSVSVVHFVGTGVFFMFLLARMVYVVALMGFYFRMPTSCLDAIGGIISSDEWAWQDLWSKEVRGTSEQVRGARMLEFLGPFIIMYLRPKSIVRRCDVMPSNLTVRTGRL